MKNTFSIGFILIFFTSCNSGIENRLNELEKENKELKELAINFQFKLDSTTKKEIKTDVITSINKEEESSNKTVYAFVHAIVKEPYLIISPNYDPNLFEYGSEMDIFTKYTVAFRIIEVTSEIEKLINYNDDRKFKFLDKTKNEMDYNYVYIGNMNFEGESISKIGRKDFFSSKCEITSTEVKTFSSYKKASIARAKITP